MLIHPRDAAPAPAGWQHWLASTGRFGMLAAGNPPSARAPTVVPAHVTVAGGELLIHPARPDGPATPITRPGRAADHPMPQRAHRGRPGNRKA